MEFRGNQTNGSGDIASRNILLLVFYSVFLFIHKLVTISDEITWILIVQ